MCSPRRECTRAPQRKRPATAADVTAGGTAEWAVISSAGGRWTTADDHATDATRRDGVTAPRKGGRLLPRLCSAQASYGILMLMRCSVPARAPVWPPCPGSSGKARRRCRPPGALINGAPGCLPLCLAARPRDPGQGAAGMLRAVCGELSKRRILSSWQAEKAEFRPCCGAHGYIFACPKRRCTHVHSPFCPLSAAQLAEQLRTKPTTPEERPESGQNASRNGTASHNQLPA